MDISETDTSYDADLLRFLMAACSWVSTNVGSAVLDATRSLEVYPMTDSSPMEIFALWARSVASVQYWTVDSPSANAEPDGVLDSAAYRFRYDPYTGRSKLYPNGGDYTWPRRLANTPFVVELNIGLDMTLPEAHFVQSIIVGMVRERHDGGDEMKMNSKISRQLEQLTPMSHA